MHIHGGAKSGTCVINTGISSAMFLCFIFYSKIVGVENKKIAEENGIPFD